MGPFRDMGASKSHPRIQLLAIWASFPLVSEDITLAMKVTKDRCKSHMGPAMTLVSHPRIQLLEIWAPPPSPSLVGGSCH